MIVFLSNSGESLPLVYRINQAGGEAKIYIHSPKYKSNYEGIVDRLPLSKLPAAVKRAEAVVVDIVRPNERTKQDRNLLKVFGAKLTSSEVFGAVGDKIRKYTPVIGASAETATWELDRNKGTEVAKEVGIAVPESIDFSTLKDGIRYLEKQQNQRWVFKPHDNQDLDLTYVESWPGELLIKLRGEYKERLGNKYDYMLQRVVEGIEISTEGWFDGERFVFFNHTIEDKKMMNGNKGMAIGSQGNTVWVKQEKGLLIDELSNLAPRLKEVGYVGPVDVNCIVSEKDQKPYFLEWSPRLGWDAFYCLTQLMDGSLEDFFTKGFQVPFADGFASSQRVTIPPFPYSEPSLLKDFAKGVRIMGSLDEMDNFFAEDVKQGEDGLECAGADGIVGVMAARGNSLGGSVGNMYRSLDTLRIAADRQYRTDGGKRAEKALRQFEKWGINVQ
jgi:phosphoribosylamine--glycine ligase